MFRCCSIVSRLLRVAQLLTAPVGLRAVPGQDRLQQAKIAWSPWCRKGNLPRSRLVLAVATSVNQGSSFCCWGPWCLGLCLMV